MKIHYDSYDSYGENSMEHKDYLSNSIMCENLDHNEITMDELLDLDDF